MPKFELCFYYADGDWYCERVDKCPQNDAEICYLLNKAGAEDLTCEEVKE